MTCRYILGRSDFHTTFSKFGHLASHSWKSFHNRLMRCCSDVWVIVRPILCNDSPEGRGESQDNDDELDVGIKDTLSYSWRTLKEARYEVLDLVVSTTK